MAINENYSDFAASKGRNQSLSVLHPIHEAAMKIADIGLNRSRHKTRDLVNLLLCHGARAWRSNQPEAKIHLHIGGRSGRAPVHMRLR
ncbi:hypothetical protein [Agrobacterium larrymoorei]|uniref:Uncharacterized protein n=1 Tax=Agrobacterium larrymoorei TaxID=160699 RepID=A0A4D7DUQ5_9HYPH|nr:hypothetical protein [Agrobacterium larrymoorei]QCI97892.1 hypothetical protein CFBP5473_08170 [Agrobacterium larrymoorei]QYA08570.1 hypothetical protein J5285_11530 [Agrobacterium larrymoorei]WHA39921.1 hypothetical protein CFBP5477_008645 [Agrobacterium larrymoorei]